MKKIILAAALSCTMILGLTACGGSSSQTSGTSDTKTETSTASSASAGETFDVGEFTVTVPDGWYAFAQSDTLADPDEDGNYPLSTDSMGLIKGGTSNIEAFSKPTIYIYKNNSDAESQAEVTTIFYDEVEDMDLELNGTKYLAYIAKTESYTDEDHPYVYNLIFIPVSDSSCFQVIVPIDMVDFEGVSIDDPDVQTIIQSLKMK